MSSLFVSRLYFSLKISSTKPESTCEFALSFNMIYVVLAFNSNPECITSLPDFGFLLGSAII